MKNEYAINAEGIHLFEIHVDPDGRGKQGWIYQPEGKSGALKFIPPVPEKLSDQEIRELVLMAGYRLVIES